MTATFFRFHFPALLWAAVIAVLTLLPSASLPPLPHWELLSFDTLAHAAVFGLLTFLVIRSLLYLYGRNNLWPAIGIAMALCLFFGIIIELLQTIMRM
ncbi:MAG TPA: hypothetical protein VK927_01100, partial [Adhaeribacter sp.]|nr:hypothetical protein [Adhaeribacter sp.]